MSGSTIIAWGGFVLEVRPSASTFQPGEAIGKDASITLLSVPNYHRDQDSEFRELLSSRLQIHINYESFYGGENFHTSWPR